MNFTRYSVETILASTLLKPDELDYLKFEFDGITFRCYGILHGITGGLNRDYRDFIKQSIRSIDGIKLAEKGMKQLYPNCGIDAELEDWAVLRKIDCIVLGFQLLADPRCLWMITIDALRETFKQKDSFTQNNRQHISDLGESPYFHYLDEQQRREIAGFLPSREAIKNDLQSMCHWYSAIIPKPRHKKIEHPQWRRLLLLERIMHIPCRSIHMLYFALAYAKKHNYKTVNLFIGETHNTDMQFLAKKSDDFFNELNSKQQAIMKEIIHNATQLGKRSTFTDNIVKVYEKIRYIGFILIGASIPTALYLFLYNFITH